MGDFNGDGYMDYVAGNNDTTETYHLDLYTNNGAGAFTESTSGS